MASTNMCELPPMIVASWAFISKNALSTCIPEKAASTCSIVATEASPCNRVVPLNVSVTLSAMASIIGLPGRSTRQDLYPLFAGAGLKVMVTSTPVCNPLPRRLISLDRVVCFSLIDNFLENGTNKMKIFRMLQMKRIYLYEIQTIYFGTLWKTTCFSVNQLFL